VLCLLSIIILPVIGNMHCFLFILEVSQYRFDSHWYRRSVWVIAARCQYINNIVCCPSSSDRWRCYCV